MKKSIVLIPLPSLIKNSFVRSFSVFSLIVSRFLSDKVLVDSVVRVLSVLMSTFFFFFSAVFLISSHSLLLSWYRLFCACGQYFGVIIHTVIKIFNKEQTKTKQN